MSDRIFGESSSVLLGGVLLLSVGLASNLLGGTPELRPIALTQDDGLYGPGLGEGVVFTSFGADLNVFVGTPSAPVINANGDLISLATLGGAGISSMNNAGVWVYRDGAVSMLAQRGDQVPGASVGLTYSLFGGGNPIPGHAAFGGFVPTISDSGAVAFVAVMQGAGVSAVAKNDDVVMSDRDGALGVAIREGDAMPGQPGDSITTPAGMFNFDLSLAEDGSFAFYTFTDVSRGLITNVSGSLESKFYLGDSLPVPYASGDWSFGWWEPAITAGGDIYHKTGNNNSGAVGFNNAIWSASGGVVPVLTGGGIGADIGDMSNRFGVNSAGAVSIIDTGDDFGEGSKLVTTAQFGVPFTIAQHTVLAPGTTSSFGILDTTRHAIAEDGTTVFLAVLSHDAQTNNSNDYGIWSNRQGTLVQLEIREGDPAPGVVGASIGNFQQMYINASGRIAFHATLTDNTHGFWIQNDLGAFELVLRTFTLLDVLGDGTDSRLVTDIFAVGSSLNGYSTSSGRAMPLNDNGDIALRVLFAGGSEGIFSTSEFASCIADLNGDGVLNFFDVPAFLQAFGNNDPIADFTGDGVWNFFDVSAFLQAFAAGCP